MIHIDPNKKIDVCGTDKTPWVPDELFGIDLRKACGAHDYASGGTAKEKIVGDFMLAWDIATISAPSGSGRISRVLHRGKSLAIGILYPLVTGTIGWVPWVIRRVWRTNI